MQSQSSGGSAGVIRIGDAVLDPSGERVGEVTRVIVDARTDTISGLVVKPGGLFPKERIIPRDQLEPSSDGLRYEFTASEIEGLSPYDPSAYAAPDPDYTGPPGFDRESAAQANLALDAAVAIGPLAGIGTSAKPLGFPGGETRAPSSHAAASDRQLPVIERGADVLDMTGSKVGEVDELSFDASGHPSALTLKRGHLFAKRLEIPASWIDGISDQGVVLNVSQDRLQAVAGGSSSAPGSLPLWRERRSAGPAALVCGALGGGWTRRFPVSTLRLALIDREC